MSKKHKKNRIPTIQSIMEGNDTPDFGDEISKINDWFNNKYDESYQFNWDGDNLIIMDGDEKEVEKFSRADLTKEIEGFPATANEALGNNTAKFNNDKEAIDAVESYLVDVYDQAPDGTEMEAVKKTKQALIDAIERITMI